RIGNKYGVVPLGAGRQERHRRADQLLDVADILDRLRRKIVPAARAGGGALPALERLVDRLDARLRALAGRQVVDDLAVEPVAGADLDFVHAVEHVELGQRDALDAVDGDGLAHQHRVEPAATALAPGNGAEL